jgi:hypothetical protein
VVHSEAERLGCLEVDDHAAGPAGSTFWIRRARSSAVSIHGQPATTNLGFGGDDWKTLFFTSRVHLGSVNLKIAGIPVPVAKKA